MLMYFFKMYTQFFVLFFSVMALNLHAMDPPCSKENISSALSDSPPLKFENQAVLLSLLMGQRIEEVVLAAPLFWTHEDIFSICLNFPRKITMQLITVLRKYGKLLALTDNAYNSLQKLMINKNVDDPNKQIRDIKNSISTKSLIFNANKKINVTYKYANLYTNLMNFTEDEFVLQITNWSMEAMMGITINDLTCYYERNDTSNNLKNFHERNHLIERRLYFDLLALEDTQTHANHLNNLLTRLEDVGDYNGAQTIKNVMKKLHFKSYEKLKKTIDNSVYIPSIDSLVKSATNITNGSLKLKNITEGKVLSIIGELKVILELLIRARTCHALATETFFPLNDIPLGAIEMFSKRKKLKKPIKKAEIATNALEDKTSIVKWYEYLEHYGYGKDYEILLRIGVYNFKTFTELMRNIDDDIRTKSCMLIKKDVNDQDLHEITCVSGDINIIANEDLTSFFGNLKVKDILAKYNIDRGIVSTISFDLYRQYPD